MGNNSNRSIKKNSDFLNLKKAGSRVTAASWLLINYQIGSDGHLRFGITASRKVGSAVVRNRLKRWCREYFRNLDSIEMYGQVDINVIFKPAGEVFYKELLYTDLVAALDRAMEVIRKKSAAPRTRNH